MSLVSTPAVVLRTYRWSETSKIVRLATRDLGVQSAVAKGALRPRSAFGAGLELLSDGIAHLYHRETRDLQTLGGFELVDLRRGLARDVARFAGATALAEMMLKMAPAAPLPAAFDAFVAGLDALGRVDAATVDAAGLRAAWLLLGALGFEPLLGRCARDGALIDAANGASIRFSVADGGVLCAACAATDNGAANLPAAAYRDLVTLNTAGAALPLLDAPHAAAHRRLVLRFVRHHLGEQGGLPALEFWMRRAWVADS